MRKMMLCVSIIFSLTTLAEIQPGLEQLMGVSVDDHGIAFQVSSNGCTERGDFHFGVEEKLENMGPRLPAFEHHYYITVNRVQADHCDAFLPYGTKVFLSFDELGIQFGKYHVTNPIGGEKALPIPVK